MHLILAGRIIDDTYKHLIQNPNVKYVGLLEHDDALKLQGQADIIPILYDLNTPINRVANPNKLFEAMMLGVPVITNVCREIVTQVECGLVVDYDFKSVKDAIYHLKNNPSLGKEMGKNGRLAFEKYYNWRLMEERLMRLYNYILLRS
jgi:glycosyltransferase involved in cell wall biosynthesis